MFAIGCGNSRVGDHGMLQSILVGMGSIHIEQVKRRTYVNIKCSGMPSFCAQ
jgi:hypothetical protein